MSYPAFFNDVRKITLRDPLAEFLGAAEGGAPPGPGGPPVAFRDDIASGVTGVMANVASLLTGAAQSGGFKGLAGRFDRRNLLSFNAGIRGEGRFEGGDNGRTVEASYRADIVPSAPAMRELMPAVLSGEATAEESREFGRLWQNRVKR